MGREKIQFFKGRWDDLDQESTSAYNGEKMRMTEMIDGKNATTHRGSILE
jgi:hypothetical protein